MLLDPMTRRIARKELSLFFASPIAYLFLGSFVAVTLFIFFWGESFFSRNIADVRPMFEWMPVLLIFLSAALTMRMWSEERRSGTLEHVLTLPANPWRFVVGKFAACMALLGIALLLTLPLPITVSMIANMDWGPILSAYLATLLLGAAYLSVGLFVSARSDNQIVSLMLTALVCGLLYLLGADVLTELVGNRGGDVLRSLSTGSRFESITRGVIDLRDLYYYASIVVVFLALNRYALEKERWASDGNVGHHRRWRTATVLIVVNALLANLWLAPLGVLRADVTEGGQYSISDATRGYLAQLQEPLLIRGYFSAKTHPLLAPLVPRLQDMLREYEVAGGGKIRVEIIDPVKNPDAEEEAGGKYGIRPTPFRVADRYQSALVNSYFDVLVKYGDEYKVLGFRDLIDIKQQSETDVDIKLRNPEYDITSAIKHVLYAYQSGGNLFATVQKPVSFTGYISSDERLPESLREFKRVVQETLDASAAGSNGKLSVEIIDPQAGDGNVAKTIGENYGFRPMASSLFDTNTFYFYLVLQDGETAVQLPLPDDLSQDGLKRGLDAGLKRFASGFTKTVGFMAPEPPNPYMRQQTGMPPPPPTNQFNQVRHMLSENMSVKPVTLADGKLPEDIDLLMLLAPENLSDKQVFAVDQFLMRGGTVIALTSPLKANLSQQGLSAQPVNSGLGEWLAHQGVSQERHLVMDSRNASFPVPMPRQVGGFTVQEMVLLDYPYFVDARRGGLNEKHPITSGLPQLTVPWATPLTVDADKNKGRNVIELVKSSEASWLSDNLDISPQLGPNGESGYTPDDEQQPSLVALALQGRFTSFYAGKESPLVAAAREAADASATDSSAQEADKAAQAEAPTEQIGSVIEHSPESARLLVVSSNDFAADQILNVLSSMDGTEYLAPAQMLVNAAEWSVEDQGLLGIRARAQFNRTLPPLSDDARVFWEYLNYGLALLAVLTVYLIRRWRFRLARSRYKALLADGGNQA